MLIGIGGRESLPFALELLERKSVSVAPGMVFGPAGEGSIRISLAADSETIVDGLSRMAAQLTERAETTA
jgi:aspartate/methionine/tyrosine aminotransferase